MFVRIKSTPKSPRKSVQIVESYRIDGKVRQRIVQHVGVAQDDEALQRLKSLAESIKEKLESQGRLPLFPEQERGSSHKKQALDDEQGAYNVDLRQVVEEAREIRGIHDIFGKLYDEFGFNDVIGNRARNAKARRVLKEIVMARVANPSSKRESVGDLRTHFGVNLDINVNSA